jgi:branched-chain amino acid transport system ATP-binding protein
MLLQVTGLTKKFGGFTAVDNVSFGVAQSEILGLLGPNGSGKSTTFNCIAGMLKPTSGSVMLDGEEIGGLLADHACRKGIGRTFQIPRPFRELSLLENATLAAFYGSRERIGRAEAEIARAMRSPWRSCPPMRQGGGARPRRGGAEEAGTGARAGHAAQAAAGR